MNKKNNVNENYIKADNPRPASLNKKVIMIAGGTLLVVIIFAVLSSIDSGTEKPKGFSNIKGGTGNVQETSALNYLPNNYQDASKIRKLLGDSQVETVQKTDPALLKQLSALQKQLEKQKLDLEKMKKKPEVEVKKVKETPKIIELSQADKQAMSAKIFFNGSTPKPIAKDKKKKDENSSIEDLNKENKKFMDGDIDNDVTNQSTIQRPISPYVIYAGSSIPGILKTRLVSNTPGSIVAIVSNDVYDSVTGSYLIIPKGSTLVGEYDSKVGYGDYQLQAKFTRLIRPDGTSIVLPNQVGVNEQGVSGFTDELDNHWGQLIGAAALTTIFNVPAVAAQYAQNQSQNRVIDGQFVDPGIGSTFSNAGIQGFGAAIAQVGTKITERAMNIQPTITINQGYKFSILVSKDIILPPYNRIMNK